MKTKDKKADKKKALSGTKSSVKDVKEQARVVVEAPAALAASATSERVLKAAPIEVLHEKPAPATPAVEKRRAITNDERRRLISMAAYYRAQRAGFGKTNPIEDWLLAEREVDAMMENGNSI